MLSVYGTERIQVGTEPVADLLLHNWGRGTRGMTEGGSPRWPSYRSATHLLNNWSADILYILKLLRHSGFKVMILRSVGFIGCISGYTWDSLRSKNLNKIQSIVYILTYVMYCWKKPKVPNAVGGKYRPFWSMSDLFAHQIKKNNFHFWYSERRWAGRLGVLGVRGMHLMGFTFSTWNWRFNQAGSSAATFFIRK